MTRPREQRKIVGILWLAPIFALESFLSLVVPSIGPTMSLFKDLYEGYSVYLFFSLMVEFLGGEARTVHLIKLRPDPLLRPWPFRMCCATSLTADPDKFLQSSKLGVMQFVVVRPVMGVLEAVLHVAGVYERGNFSPNNGYVYVEFIINASVSWAFYCLVLFYMCLNRPLQPHDPFPKFLSIKAVVFLSFWQGVLLAILAEVGVIREVGSWTVDNTKTGIQNMLICFEMLLAAWYHRYAFDWRVYDRGRTSSFASVGLDDNFAFSDARRDFGEMLPALPETFNRLKSHKIVHAEDDQDGKAGGGGGKGHDNGRKGSLNADHDGEQPLLRDSTINAPPVSLHKRTGSVESVVSVLEEDLEKDARVVLPVRVVTPMPAPAAATSVITTALARE